MVIPNAVLLLQLATARSHVEENQLLCFDKLFSVFGSLRVCTMKGPIPRSVHVTVHLHAPALGRICFEGSTVFHKLLSLFVFTIMS